MDQAITLLEHYKYAILLPLAIIEGPILMVVAGFLVTLGFLNAFLVYLIIVLGDIIGDSFAYSIGRYGGAALHRIGAHMGATPEKTEQARAYFSARHTKAIVTSKLVHGIGIAGLITAGALKIPYPRYVRSCLLVSLPQAAVLLIVGILFGHAYVQIGKYLDNFATLVSIGALAVILGFILYKLKFKRS